MTSLELRIWTERREKNRDSDILIKKVWLVDLILCLRRLQELLFQNQS